MVLGALVIIVVGVLVVNYFKDREGRGQITPNAEQTASQVTVGKTYTVAKGDNLWTIAEKAYGSGYNWVDIAKANNLKNANILVEGQSLSIPDVEPKLATKVSITDQGTTVKATVKGAEPITGATYQVVKGDNLWNIAVRAYGDGFKWTLIAQANQLVNPNLIHRGNILILPR
jgi:nucleoid-associated protein YgaU